MNTRRTRSLLWLTTIGFLAAAGSVVVLHVMRPPAVVGNLASEKAQEDPAHFDSSARAYASIDQASLLEAANKDIRQRLFDPPVETPKPPPPKPLPPIELISTILRDNGEHSAWVRDGQATRKIAVDDTLGPEGNRAIIRAITAGKLTIEHEGKQVELEQALSAGGRR